MEAVPVGNQIRGIVTFIRLLINRLGAQSQDLSAHFPQPTKMLSVIPLARREAVGKVDRWHYCTPRPLTSSARGVSMPR